MAKRPMPANSRMPYIKYMIYNEIHPNRKFTQVCGKYTCLVESGATTVVGADLVLFYEIGVNSFKKPPNKPAGVLWAFVSKEPGFRLKNVTKYWNNMFNYSATYDRESPGNMHIFRSQINKMVVPSHYTFYPKNIAPEPRALWFVSRCHPKGRAIQSARDEYALELSKYMQIDVYTRSSKCRNKLHKLVKEGEEPNISDSHFYLSFESTSCKDYILLRNCGRLWKPTIPLFQ